jgi:L-ascorbate metabolism protein UlaG (beta-lactamase superfamily)
MLAILLGWLGFASAGFGQTAASRCLAIAQSAPAAMPVAFVPAQAAAEEVTIRFIGHSTFLITSPAGVTIATDYNGFAGAGVLPRVVTMNQAHSSHNTPSPDARIEHVLRGWNPAGGRAEHHLQIDDVLIRSVSTDIRGWDTVRIPDGNSIFIFETARLCIGHLVDAGDAQSGEGPAGPADALFRAGDAVPLPCASRSGVRGGDPRRTANHRLAGDPAEIA